jgi:hypothetical protein
MVEVQRVKRPWKSPVVGMCLETLPIAMNIWARIHFGGVMSFVQKATPLATRPPITIYNRYRFYLLFLLSFY